MPRGVPNYKRDEVPMRFTLFNIPPQMNQKQGGSNYLKSEEQTLSGRSRAQRKNDPPLEGRRGSNVIVIHPGSRFLRIGRASDVYPVAIPNVIARKSKIPVPAPVHMPKITSKCPIGTALTANGVEKMEVDSGTPEPWDPADPKTSPIASSLRDRMVFYKLHIVPKASEVCTTFNEHVRPEIIADHNDPYRVDWIEGNPKEETFIGEKVLRLADPHKMGYTIRWPFHGGRFNYADYAMLGPQGLLNDIETIWRHVLRDFLKIKLDAFKDYSVVLIVPDLFERSYVRELCQLLLVQMNFKNVCVQQESISATYGAGISNACVVDAGASYTSIAVVDEGLVIPDTRISLNMGGDDITEFLLVLLQRVHFPYRDADLSHLYDWKLLEDLKARICTLQETDVAMNGYDFTVRRPRKATERYSFRAYNETILASMCLFEPRVIDFDHKVIYTRSLWDRDVGDEIVEQANDQITNVMIISTQHLLPNAMPPPPPPLPPVEMPTFSELPEMEAALNNNNDEGYGRPMFSFTSQSKPQTGGTPTGRTRSKFISLGASDFESEPNLNRTEISPPSISQEPQQSGERPVSSPSSSSTTKVRPPANERDDQEGNTTQMASTAAVPVVTETETEVKRRSSESQRQEEQQLARENNNVTAEETEGQLTGAGALSHPPQTYPSTGPPSVYPGGFGIDIAFEAGKLPLDVAIFNSARAAGGDEKIRKYLQAVLVVGGTALVPGMAHALESRLQAIATPLVPNMEKVQIIPPPRDVDPRVLCWKGGAVLGKMEAVADLWVSRMEWDTLGMRALKERSFFL